MCSGVISHSLVMLSLSPCLAELNWKWQVTRSLALGGGEERYGFLEESSS